ncbi:MAG: hypothetical protein ACI9EF_001244 [Pseudohongiellaceae bacterium]|jgi:hypothetical protein
MEHGGDSYLCVEGGYNPETRAITLLAAPGNGHFPQEEGALPLAWRNQGEWFPIARLIDGELTLQNQEHQDRSEFAAELIQRYSDEALAGPDQAWVLRSSKGFSGSLEDVLPQGMAVGVFDSVELAEEAAGDDTVVPIQYLATFLTHLAREGYAGAMWNQAQPIFFCTDEASDLQFLRLSRGRSETVEMEMLDPLIGWEPYEGAEDISFLENGDACDARLAEVLDQQPLLGWPDDGQLWSLGPQDGEPGLVTVDEDGLAYALLFSEEEAADAWLADVEEPWVRWSVKNLGGLLSSPTVGGCGGLLNPGAHRARRGVFWQDGERTILDSFSGFWLLSDQGFAALGE